MLHEQLAVRNHEFSVLAQRIYKLEVSLFITMCFLYILDLYCGGVIGALILEGSNSFIDLYLLLSSHSEGFLGHSRGC